MRGVLLAAVVIVSLMALIKDGRALRRIGLTGSCAAVVAPVGQTGYWEKCRPGKLEGAPDLSRRSCKAAGTIGKDEYWQCPAPIGSAQGT